MEDSSHQIYHKGVEILLTFEQPKEKSANCDYIQAAARFGKQGFAGV